MKIPVSELIDVIKYFALSDDKKQLLGLSVYAGIIE